MSPLRLLGSGGGALKSSGPVSITDSLCLDLAALRIPVIPGSLELCLDLIGKPQPVLLGCWEAKLPLQLELLIGKKRNDVQPLC